MLRILAALVVAVASADASTSVASGLLRIVGLRLEVEAPQALPLTVPLNTPFTLTSRVRDGAGREVHELSALGSGIAVTGELSGAGLAETVAVTAAPGQPLDLPGLGVAGNYTLANLRLVDASGATVLTADPALVPIRAIEKVIVSRVRSRALSLDEIEERDVIITADNFTAYEFSIGVKTESKTVEIPFDVVMGDGGAEVGGAGLPPVVPGLEVPNLEYKGMILEPPHDILSGVKIPPIPGVIVIPGNIAFLNQFFQVLLVVSNVAPEGSELVVIDAGARLALPPGANGVVDDPVLGNSSLNDDPLRPVETALGGTEHVLCGEPGTYAPLLCAAVHNSATGDRAFSPGEDGQGEFLVEGRKVGTHQVEVTIRAELRLATGEIVPLEGKTYGTVLVRHPRFALTLNHPDVVRAGETYSLLVTVTNVSDTMANLVGLSLEPARISGATLVGAGCQQSGDRDRDEASLPPGTVRFDSIASRDAVTARFDLIARKNGRVTAAAFEGDPSTGSGGVAGAFVLRTGIGDAGIPLSPDTLILPPYAYNLPGPFIAEALRVLGLAHSVASAPLASADTGHGTGQIPRIDGATVVSRAQDLAEAGLRVRIRAQGSGDRVQGSGVVFEAMRRELLELWLDWLGNGEVSGVGGQASGFDAGFDEIMRLTDAGHDLESVLAAEVVGNWEAGDGSAVDLHDAFVQAEAYRSGFISIAADSDARLTITDGVRETSGCIGAARCPQSVRREVASASILGFDDATGVAGGEWAIVGDASQLSAAAQVTIAAGSTDTTVHVAVPNGDGELQVFEFTVYAGESVTRNLRRPDTRLPTPAAVADGPPRVLGVRQIPEADKQRRGRVVAVLFDQAVDESSLETATFRLSYAPGQEEEQAVGPVQNGLKRLNLFPRKRIVFLQFRSSVSRFFDYEMTIAGVRSRGGLEQIPESDLWAVVGDFPKEQSGVGGIVSGTVRDGNGDPIPFATVELTETFENPELCLPFHLATGSVSTDENGYYRFDFAGDGRSDGCDGHWPFRVRAVDADTGQKAERRTFITFEGERRRLDLLMLGLGRVEGHVWNAECGMGDEECGVSGATVTVTSLVDGGQRHTTTDARGRFAVENVAVGNLEVSAWFDPKGPAGPRAGSVAARLERAGEMAEVEVLISANTAAVEGTVFEECGMGNAECRMGMVPVGGGVDVVAFWFADGNEWGAPTYVRTVETDAAGHFEFPAVPAPKANTVLHVRAFRTETSEQIERTVMLSPGSTTPVNLILPGNATVMGTVVHADGRPAPGAEVVAEQGTRLAVADTSGNFALAQVGAGRQAIFAQDPGSGAQGHVDVDVWPPGGAVAVRITLAGFAGIDGVLRDSTGGLQRGAEVFLWFGKQGFLRTTTDSMGRFSYRRLPLRQDYVLGASDANGAGVNLPLGPLAAGEIRPVVLQFAGVETVTGVVFDDGVPRVVAVRVTYQHFDDTGNLSWQTREVTASAPVGTTRCAVDCASGGEDCAAWAGRFSLVMLRGASYRVQVVDDAFAGDTTEQGGTAGVSGEHCLEMGQSASLHGTVYLPDGERGGAGIEITYDETSGGNPRQRLTDESGEFALEMLPPREYRLSARDPRTGNLGIAFGSLEGSSAGKAEINLLGQGTVRARVLRPGGNGLVPIEGASVDLTSGSPVARLRAAPFPTLVTDPNGIVEFRSVPEGAFSVAAFDELTLTGGRAGGQIVADQEETTVSVIVGASGTVQGRLSDAGGTTPLAFAQVRLRYVCAPPLPCVKRLDDYATSDENGVYRFEYVPVGGVAMECFDPRTGRVGRHQSVIVPAVKFAGDVVTADMHLIPVGGVTGSVLRPAGTRVVGAKVELRSSLLVRPEGLVRDVSLFGPGKLATTSNLLGEYLIPGVPEGEFDLIATEPTTGASGAGGGRIAAEGEVVAVDLTLDGRGAVIGTSTLADGVTPVGFATVVFENGAEQRAVQSDAAGAYRVANVPLGFFTITVREQGGNDGGRSTGVVAEDGEVVRVDVAFGGAGTVSGCARGGDEPLGAALVTLIREDPAGFLPSRFDVFTNSQGEYDFFDVPVGAFTVQLTVDGLSGARSGSLAADGEHVMGIDIELEASGTVTGRVERADGTGAGGAVVALGDSGASFRFFRVADETGAYAFHHVPLGTLVVSVSDPVTGGVGTTSGTLDGESLVLPLITLDDTIPAVESIAPADGTLGVARATEIVITFDDLVDAASVNRDSIKVHSLGAEIPGRYRVESQHDTSVVRFSADDPAGLPEFAALTVEVTQRVRDLLGRPILLAARSTFQTMDQSPPTVLGANLVRGWLVVRWSEAVEWTAPHGPGLLLLADVTDAAPGTTIEGTLVPSESGRVLTFKPTQPLADDRVLALEVSGWTDVFGNAQASVFKSTLDTTDHNPPLIVLSSSAVDGAATIGESVRISAAPAAGVTDILLVDFYAGAQKIGTDNTPPFTHEFVAARDVTFTAQAMDFAGNLGPAESITITLRPNAPPSAIILSPVGGAMVKTGDRFSVSVSASDDLGLADIELTVFENTYAHHVPPGLKSTSHEFLVRAPSHATPDPQSPLRVRARDVSGIMSAVEQITLDLRDGTAPSVQLTSLAGGFVADPAVLVPVSVFASDAAGVARITLTVMGDADHFAEVLFQPVPAVAHEFAPLDLSAAAGGSVTIIVSAEDSAGNAAEAPRVTLTVQGAPSIELIEPDPHNPPSIIGGAAITVRAKTGNALVKQVGFYLDDVLIGTDMTAEPGNVFRLSLLTPTGRQNAGIGVEGIDVFGVHTERRMLVLPLRANGLPVASAGLDRQVSIGLTSTLSGSGSFDPDASPLSYLWRLVDRPADSTATIVNGQQRAARITPDVDGVYTIGLVVNDGIDDSGEDLVVLTAHEATATPTPTDTRSPTLTRTVTASRTITATPTDTRIATETRTSTATRTFTGTPTVTPLPTDTRTPTETRSVTPTRTGTRTVTETRTPTSTRTATRTRTPTLSPTPTMTPAPGEILVNQTTSGYQWLQDACSDAHGNTLIVWSDEHGRLLGRRVDPSEEGGAEFPINELGGNVSHPRVACAPDGRFVVVWSGGFTYPAYTAYFRRYTNSGEPEGESAMVEAGTESQDTPDVAMAADGSFLVVWEESHAIIGKRYDATGAPLGPAFPVSKATEAVALDPAVTVVEPPSDAERHYVLVWREYDSGLDRSALQLGQVPLGTGAPIGDEIEIAAASGHGALRGPALASQPKGEVFVTWTDLTWNLFGREFGTVRAIRVDAGGVPGAALGLGTTYHECFSHGSDKRVSRSADGYAVTWAVARDPETCDYDVFVHLYGADDEDIGDGFQVNAYSAGEQTGPVITCPTECADCPPHCGACAGNCTVVWNGPGPGDSWGIFARRLTYAPMPAPTPTPSGPTFTPTETPTGPAGE